VCIQYATGNYFTYLKKIDMNKLLLAAVVAVTILYSCTPKMSVPAQPITDAAGSSQLMGICTKADLQQKPFSEWFVKNHDGYTVDETVATQLKERLRNKQLTIFMGTWCGDSKREVPRIYKVLERCGIKEKQVTLVMVSNHDSAYKQSPGREEKGLHIHRVPTLLINDNGQELGRIVESPVGSWEKDLLAICSGQPYTPNYAGAEYMYQQLQQLGTEGVLKDSSRITAQLRQLLKSEYEVSALAKMLRTTGQLPQALTTALLNKQVFADKADAWYMAGVYQQLSGQWAMAKECYQKAIALQPGHKNATEKLAELQ
jgi:thiol-disulfide isomerase/thioredoxin